jgi:CelD/BcsL family acetyltransferase involved in cellulose biosynthesis
VSLTVVPVTSVDALRSEWEQLDARTSPRLPFTSPLWTQLWWQHFRERRVFIQDTLHLLGVRDSSGGLRGVAPLVLTERPAVGPLRTRMLRFVGADPAITEVCGPICAPADEREVMAALLEHFDGRGAEWDLWLLNGLRRDGEAAAAVGLRPGVQRGREIPDYVLALPADWVKESMRKGYNSLKRDGLVCELRVLTAPEQMSGALDRFFALHASRAALEGTVVHRNVFGSANGRAFLRDYCREMAWRGLARVFQLAVGGQIVATRLAFVVGDSLYLYFSGFDPAWGRYSVMTTLVAEALRWAIAQRFATVNLSPGNDVSKTRWAPTEVVFQELLLPAPSLRGALVRRAYCSLRARSAMGAGLAALARRRGA